MKESKTLTNIPNLNKEIIYMGLKPGYWLALVLVLFICFLIFKIYALILFIPLIYFLLKLERESKKGNPDFLKSNTNYKRIPKSIVDTDSILKHL